MQPFRQAGFQGTIDRFLDHLDGGRGLGGDLLGDFQGFRAECSTEALRVGKGSRVDDGVHVTLRTISKERDCSGAESLFQKVDGVANIIGGDF